MGAWGYGLFQSDQELDLTANLPEEAGRLANDPDFTFWYPENRDQVVHKLNAGLFHQLLEIFKAKNWKHGIVYLGALSMQLGVKIGDGDMQVLRDTLPRATMCDEARAQMQKGLDGYKGDGEGWDFESLGLEETMMTTKAENWRPNSYGAMGFNVLQDFRKMPTPMPKDGEVEANDEDGAGPDGVKGEMKKEPTGRDALSDKAKLNAWFLC